MKIELRNISKKFGKNTVLKNISEVFEPATSVAIIGSNGRGKSTLLKIISGYLSPDKGEVYYNISGKSIESHMVAQRISYLAPYISFQDDLTISETFNLVSDFRPTLLSEDNFMQEFDLDRTKRLADLSTGMKQRFHLGLCFYQKSDVILLDEPTSFLDEKWKGKYHELIYAFRNERLIILSSNDSVEYRDFNRIVDLG